MPAGAEFPFDDSYQAGFARRWGHLTRPAVRALAWLLESPDLLDPAGQDWQGSVATLGAVDGATAAWLAALERDSAPLDAALGERSYSRLGLYAEKLMAFYFAQRGDLVAHGLQVRAARNDTVGEFDFLLAEGDGLRHIEFATKFYLLDSVDDGVDPADFDLLVGPNLADTLGRKMRKIFSQQLALSRHPAAQAVLDRPVTAAQALVKGWLFYPPGPAPRLPGIGARHCRGHWHTVSNLAAGGGEQFVVMPRLQWLAPLQVPAQPGRDGAMAPTPPPLTRAALAALLHHKFETDRAPVMVAAVRREGDWLLEQSRAFVVPDEWPALAAQRRIDKRL